MKVDRFLALLGDDELRSALPEGAMLIEEINRHSKVKHSHMELTGTQTLEIISTLDAYRQKKLLAWELNDGLETERARKETRAQLEKARSGKYLKPAIAFGMAGLITLLTLAYTAMILWTAYHTKTLPDWEQMVLPYIVPGFVMWKYFGIINDETKALMAAVVESTPVGGIASKVYSRFKDRRSGDQPNMDNDSPPMRPPPRPADFE